MQALNMLNELTLDSENFRFFQSAIRDRAGISLSESKRDLIQSRLRSRIQSLNLSSFDDYRRHLQSQPQENTEWQVFVNLLTTNKTDFFREPKHFDFLEREFLPKWKAKSTESLKVWSAACSTGEEPYTISMVLAQTLGPQCDYRILASDIDSDVLRKASAGVYPASRIREQVPENYLSHSVDFGRGDISGWARISPKVKERISFKQHNLVEASYPGDEIFDLIFLRNVLIYFSPETIQFVVEKLYKSAKPGGLLFIGHSESLNGLKTSWTSLSPSVYVKAKN